MLYNSGVFNWEEFVKTQLSVRQVLIRKGDPTEEDLQGPSSEEVDFSSPEFLNELTINSPPILPKI